MDTRIVIPGLDLKNPVMPASGTCGYGEELSAFYDLNLLGGFVTKSATGKERFGNPLPRIAEGYEGSLNCIGLENPGVETVASVAIPKLRRNYHGPLLVSIAGSDEEEYRYVLSILEKVEGIDAYEINISCPNVSRGGMALGTDPKAAKAITALMKKEASRPIYMKLTPNVMDISEIALACQEGGADGLVIRLSPTSDIAKELGGKKRKDQYLVGFALETDNEEVNAKGKLLRKHFDFIVLNSTRNKGTTFRSDDNQIEIITDTSKKEYPKKSKADVASDIIDELMTLFNKN